MISWYLLYTEALLSLIIRTLVTVPYQCDGEEKGVALMMLSLYESMYVYIVFTW